MVCGMLVSCDRMEWVCVCVFFFSNVFLRWCGWCFFCGSNSKVKWDVLCLIFWMFLIFVVGWESLVCFGYLVDDGVRCVGWYHVTGWNGCVCFFFLICVWDGVGGMYFCRWNSKVKWGVFCLVWMFCVFQNVIAYGICAWGGFVPEQTFQRINIL